MAKPDYQSDTEGAAKLKAEQDAIAAKQQEMDDQQKKIDDLEAELGKASAAGSEDRGLERGCNMSKSADTLAPSEFRDVHGSQTLLIAIIVVPLQKRLPVFGGDGVTRGVHEIQRSLDHRKYNRIFLPHHAR